MKEEYYTTRELAKFLGVSRQRVLIIVKSKNIPVVRLGGLNRYPAAAFDAYMEERKKQQLGEIKNLRGNHDRK